MPTDPKKLKQAEETLKKINAIYRELGKASISLNTEEIKDYPILLQQARMELTEMEGSATNLYDQLRGVTLEIGKQQTSLGKARKGFRDITKAADELLKDEQEIEKLNLKQLSTLKQKTENAKADINKGAEEIKLRNKAYSVIQKQLDEMKAVNATEEELLVFRDELISKNQDLTEEQKAILAAHHDQNSVIDEIIKKTADRLAEEERIEQAASAYAKTATFISSIPGLKAFAGPFEKAAEAAKEAARSTESALKVAQAAGKELGKSALLQGVSLAGVFTLLKDAVFGVNAKQVELGKQFGVSEAGAKKVYKQFKAIKDTADDNLMTTKNLIGSNTQLAGIMGTNAGFSKEQLMSQVELTKKIGIQEQSAAKLQRLSMASNQSTNDALQAINEQNVALRLQTGITLDNRGVIEEVAQTDGQLAANYANNPKLIAKAVMQTRKLGLSLKQAAKMASGLLDFESSISKEMEAEMLIGRDLNLDRARALALQGDAAGAAAAIAEEVGTIEDFNNLNVIQQQALAEAAGMTADELANSLTQTKNLNSLGGKQKKALEDQVKTLREQGKIEEANRLLSVAGNAEELDKAQKRLSFEQRINAAKDMAIERVSELITANGGVEAIVERIVGFFENLPAKLNMIKGMIATITGVVIGLKIASIGASIAQAALAAGLIASASAATLGIGIAAIVAGIAAGGLAYSAMTDKSKKSAKKSIKDGAIDPSGGLIMSGPKGTIQLDKQDSVVAGTDLFGNKNSNNSSTDKLLQKLDKLISIVENGGNVYLDGSKVGQALVLSSKLST